MGEKRRRNAYFLRAIRDLFRFMPFLLWGKLTASVVEGILQVWLPVLTAEIFELAPQLNDVNTSIFRRKIMLLCICVAFPALCSVTLRAVGLYGDCRKEKCYGWNMYGYARRLRLEALEEPKVLDRFRKADAAYSRHLAASRMFSYLLMDLEAALVCISTFFVVGSLSAWLLPGAVCSVLPHLFLDILSEKRRSNTYRGQSGKRRRLKYLWRLFCTKEPVKEMRTMGFEDYLKEKWVASNVEVVKEMEELGIGRPSTYAATITTILARRYVTKEEKNLYVTELGEVVNGMMKEAFPSIVDVNFTANMEALLDGVEEGQVKWKTIVSNFYPDLETAVDAAEKELEHVSIADEVSDEVCDLCGRQMVIKYGPHGRFLACPGFPECRNTKPYFEKIGVACPKCGKDVVLKKTKKGRKYYGCIDNPECDFMVWQKPSGENCPQCGSALLIKGNKLVCADAQCGFHKLSEKLVKNINN